MNSTSLNRHFTGSTICSSVLTVKTCDASGWANALNLINSKPGKLPVVAGQASLEPGKPVDWQMEVFNEKQLGTVCRLSIETEPSTHGQISFMQVRN